MRLGVLYRQIPERAVAQEAAHPEGAANARLLPTLRASGYFFSANSALPMRKWASGSAACTCTAAWKE